MRYRVPCELKMTSVPTFAPAAICFGEKLANSGAFKTLFRDGMALVEETAAYLDGDGRDEARMLPRLAGLTYASESMRLTTRLMQIASWLLLQRAVNEGEMTPTEASADKRRTRVAWQQASATPAPDELLPAGLRDLIAKSVHLQEQIARFDVLITEPAKVPAAGALHPLEGHFAALQKAFPTSA